MTEAGWTRNAPTKEGWYWWKRTENDNPVIVWVNAFHPDKQLRAEMISGRRELLTHFTGLFNGPLSPTDRQQRQVEALQAQLAAAQKVKADYDRWLSGGVYFTTVEYKKHVAEHQQQIEALQAQLPAEMQGCTILFKECEKGHGRLVATNWRDHGCQTCEVEALQAQIARAKESCRCYSNWWDRKIPERPSYEVLQQQVEALQREHTQLQALMRALFEFKCEDRPEQFGTENPMYEEGDEACPFFTEAYLYVLLGKEDARSLLVITKQLRALLPATMDATTPAADTSIIGKCEPPSQWNRNAQVRGDIS